MRCDSWNAPLTSQSYGVFRMCGHCWERRADKCASALFGSLGQIRRRSCPFQGWEGRRGSLFFLAQTLILITISISPFIPRSLFSGFYLALFAESNTARICGLAYNYYHAKFKAAHLGLARSQRLRCRRRTVHHHCGWPGPAGVLNFFKWR